MIGVTIIKSTNPNEVTMHGEATGTANAWYTMITVPDGIVGELRTISFSIGMPYTGTWDIQDIRVQRGATTLWHGGIRASNASFQNRSPNHFDVNIPLQPGDTIDFNLSGTPSFSTTGIAAATVILPASSSIFASYEEYPVCGLRNVDEGRPDICRLAALSTLLTYMLHSDPHLFGGIPTRMEAL